MKDFFDWVWNGPWWTLIVAALYAAVLIGIAFSPVLGAIKATKRD